MVMTVSNVTSPPAPTIMRDYPAGRVPRETIRVADDVYYRFDQLVGTTATYNLASRKAWQDMTRDEGDADNKAHKNWLRVTKWLRDAEQKAEAIYNRRESELENRCGFGFGSPLYGPFNPRDAVTAFLGLDDDGENYLAFLEKIAPQIEAVYLKAAGFETWEEFGAARDAKFAAWRTKA
jgi:hypothetical protein